MTSQTGRYRGWRRAVVSVVAGSALAAGLLAGTGPALADPVAPTTEADAPAADAPTTMTADQALAIIDQEYDTGAGGGQLSTLIHKIMQLRSQGFYASEGNRKAIVAALDKKPNQEPLIQALENTLSFQMKSKARAAAQPQQPATIGLNPAGAPGGQGGINIPLGP